MSKPWATRIALAVAGGCALLLAAYGAPATAARPHDRPAPARSSQLDQALETVLRQAGFTGRIQTTLEQRLGHRVDARLANVGRLLWFDTITGLNNDNASVENRPPWSPVVLDGDRSGGRRNDNSIAEFLQAAGQAVGGEGFG